MLITKLKTTIQKYKLLKQGNKVLLCVSGGPDSTAMFYAFLVLKKEMGLELYAAHLNHLLRDAESDKDEDYVKGLAEKNGVPVLTEKFDVKALAEIQKLSLEDAARRARYKFFKRAADHYKIDVIATAHTSDDQAETMLMRILRGTGLKGLCGILPKRKIGKYTIIRPMLEISRQEVMNFIKMEMIKPRYDKSNKSTNFLRNKIRLKLMPLLEKEYSPNIKILLSILADTINNDYEYLAKMYTGIFLNIAKIKNYNSVSLSLSKFKILPISAQRSVLRQAVEKVKGNLDNIDFRHLNELGSLISERPVSSIVHLPGGIETVKTKLTLQFRLKRQESLKENYPDSVLLKIPGITKFGRYRIKANLIKGRKDIDSLFGIKSKNNKKLNKNEEFVDIENIKQPLFLRLKKDGDRLKPFGMNRYKKVKAILIDDKIPYKRRGNIPLLISSDNKILWLCGVRLSEDCRVSSKSKNILRLQIR